MLQSLPRHSNRSVFGHRILEYDEVFPVPFRRKPRHHNRSCRRAIARAYGRVYFADPDLPAAEVDTTYSLPTGGTTHECDTAAEFTTALGSCSRGDVIVLTAGNTFTGTFTLPNLGAGTDWVYIISSSLASLSEGTRVGPSDTSNMPLIRQTSAVDVFDCENSASYFRLAGLEIAMSGVAFTGNMITLGAASSPGTQSNAPNHIIFDRCYVHGDGTNAARRAFRLDGEHQAVIDSYVDKIFDVGSDSQTILGLNGAGPFKIYNCHLEGAGENLMFGGGDPDVTNLVPSDITIQRCDFYKPTSWISPDIGDVKNNLELKNARRVLVEGCILENCWQDVDQAGFGLVFTPRNQDNTATWCTVEHVTFRLCKILDCEAGINMLTTDDTFTSQDLNNILIENVLVVLKDHGQGGSGRASQITCTGGPATNITFRNVTLLEANGEGHMVQTCFMGDTVDSVDNLVVQDCVFFSGAGNPSGWAGSGASGGNDTLNTYVLNDNYTFSGNVAYAQNSNDGTWPTGVTRETTLSNIGFDDYANGDYRISSGTYAGKGADIDAIEAAYAGTGGGGSLAIFLA